MDVEERIGRLEDAVVTMAHWLGQTPGVWGARDVRGIEQIIRPELDPDLLPVPEHDFMSRAAAEADPTVDVDERE